LADYVTASALNTTLASYVTTSALSTTLADYVTNTSLTTTLAAYGTKSWVESNYISKAFFNRLFRAFAPVAEGESEAAQVEPNDVTTEIDNVKAMFGLWTEQYLSALGLGSDAGQTIGVLDDLNDVTITNPQNDQVLKYNNGIWVNAVAPSGASALSGLTDVAISSLADKDLLQWDYASGKWKNVVLSTAMSAYALASSIPTNVSQLNNDSGYITSAALSGYATTSQLANYLPLSGGVLAANNTWLTPARMQLMRYDTTIYSDRACIGVTNGNLHIDAYNGKAIYLNYYQDNVGSSNYKYVYFNGGTYYIDRNGYYNGSVSWSNVSGRPTNVSSFTNDSGYITGITSSMVTTALGYTPANSASLSDYLPLSAGSSYPLNNTLYIQTSSVVPQGAHIKSASSESSYISLYTSDNKKVDIGFLGGSSWGTPTTGGAYLWTSQNNNEGGIFVSGSGLYYTDNAGNFDKYTVYHTGNLSPLTTSNYSSYCLPLSGGTMTGNLIFLDGGHLGNVSYSWGGLTHPTVWGETTSGNAYVMITTPHIPYLENGSRGYTGDTYGSIVRFEGGISAGSYWDIGVPTTDIFEIKRSGTEIVQINSSGNIGIGVSPTQALDVNGNVRIRKGLYVEGDPDYNEGGEVTLVSTSGSQYNIHLDSYNANFRIHSNGSVYMAINSSGDVGIGTSSPSYKLHVAGDIYATGGVTALSDIRKKDVISRELPLSVEQIAAAPTIKFLWKDKREEGEQVGTIAQYWEKALPWVIKSKSGELSMSYGVAALISSITIARKVVNHEQRITELERECERLRFENEQLRLKIA
jgi:hypothetical protein